MNIVIGTRNCPWCKKAKELLEEHELKYVYLDYHESDTAKSYIQRVSATTVPQIWMGGKHIGGHDDLVASLKAKDARGSAI